MNILMIIGFIAGSLLGLLAVEGASSYVFKIKKTIKINQDNEK